MPPADSSSRQPSPSPFRQIPRWACLIGGAIITFLVGYVWLQRLTSGMQPSTAAEEIWFLLGNLAALAFVAWLLSGLMRRIIRRPRLAGWLLSWRILRRVLLAVACFITLVAGFYTVENWRGWRAWEQCKRELEAKGETLNWEAFIPPPVPDEQNFFKAPGMTAWFNRRARGTNQNVRIYSVTPALSLMASTRGILDELRSLPEKPAASDAATSAVSRAGLRAAFAEYEPEYRRLADACQRPKSRLADDYNSPFELHIPNFVNGREVAQTLSVHAGLNVLDSRPDVALQDLVMMRRVGEVMDDSHTLVGTMIHVAILGVYIQTARDAFEAGLWQEPQMAALQHQTREVDLLASLARSWRGAERVGVIRVLDRPPDELAKVFAAARSPGGSNVRGGIDWHPLFTRIKLELCPRGWFLQNQASLCRFNQAFLDSLEVSGRRIHSARLNALNDRWQNLPPRSPYTFLATLAMPNFSLALQHLARTQTQVDQLHVACALERYRLTHGSYPEKLDALMPALLDHVPKDLFSDGPLKYHRDDQGGYLLWSVGWDEKDGGGVQSLGKDGKPAYDASPGDWVWQHIP